MRILLIGPCHPGGSIPPYLDVLPAALRHCGARVHRIVSAGRPYEPAAPAQAAAPRLARGLDAAGGAPVGSLCGYAPPWKDPATLLTACQQATAPARIVLAGPFWDDPAQAGADLTRESAALVPHGPVEVTVVAEYLGHGARRALAAASHFAVLPYPPQPAFQGIRAIADYLAHGVPGLSTDLANMAEITGDAGPITPPRAPAALAGS